MKEIISNSIGKDAAYLSFAKVAILGVSLLSNMLLSRFRTLEEYGTYSQITIIINLVTALLMLGVPASVNYYLSLAETRKERNTFLSVYYTLTTSICFGIGALIVAFIPLLETYFGNTHLREFAYFFAIYPFANVTIGGISNVYIIYGKTKTLAIVNLLAASIALVSVLIVEIEGLSFNEYMSIFLLGNMTLALFLLYKVNFLDGKLSISFNAKIIKEIFKYSIPIGFASLVGTINLEVDKLMIGNLLDTESLAIYANAGKELPLVFIASSLTAVLLPFMVRMLKNGMNVEAVNLWGKTIHLSYIFMCFFTTLCVAFAPQVMTFLYSDKYLSGVSVFVIYSFVLLLRTTYFGIVLSSLGRTKLIMWSSIAALCLNIILNVLFYRIFNFIGPALASFASIFLVNLLQLLWSSKLLKVPFACVFPWKSLGKVTLVNLAWGSVAYIIIGIFNIGTSTKDLFISFFIGVLFSNYPMESLK